MSTDFGKETGKKDYFSSHFLNRGNPCNLWLNLLSDAEKEKRILPQISQMSTDFGKETGKKDYFSSHFLNRGNPCNLWLNLLSPLC